ncbi:unnamed protein product [Closterium sp. Yama58-4]|nr:unnamed protein product [Closterium sp. Yama58-4]
MEEEEEEVAVPGYVRDIEELLRDFVNRADPSLAAFKAVWRALRFSFVHDACPKDIDPRSFLQLLYGTALGFLQARTAPYPPTLIYLPLDSLRLLLLFAQEAPRHKAWDAVAALQSLFFGPLSSLPSGPPPAASSSSPHTLAPPATAFVVGAVPLPQQLQAGMQQRAGQARRLVEQQLRVMKHKLFAHLPIERHIQSDAAEALDVEQADAACWLYDNSLQRLKTCGLLTEGASFAQEGELAAVFSAYRAAREAAVGALEERGK